MQLYAQDQKGTRVFVELAEKAKIYFCLECQKEVRARGGPHIQLHFYHTEKNGLCRQNGKTDQHLELQKLLHAAYPGAEQELRFEAIGRIADVAHIEKKIVFEVQCSPMTREEMSARVQDYRSIGFEIIWILSDKSFLKRKVTALEIAIAEVPHYFAKGVAIFDVCSFILHGMRVGRPVMCRVEVDQLKKRQPVASVEALPEALLKRHAKWEYHFKGDLLEQEAQLFAGIVAKEQEHKQNRSRFSVRGYLKGLYRGLLAQSCR